MPAIQLLQALQLVVQGALPDAAVIFGIPKVFHDPVVVYLWRDGPPEDVIKTTGTVRRHHDIHLHLLVQSVGDDYASELLFYDLTERLADAFQTNRRLLGMGATSTLHKKPLGAQYVLISDAEYRACAWTWDAEEQLTFAFA